MSLGDTTKCDLSAGIAKVDKQILIKTLNCHYHYMLRLIRDNLKQFENNETGCSCFGSRLLYAVTELRRTAELLHTLKESDNDREVLFI